MYKRYKCLDVKNASLSTNFRVCTVASQSSNMLFLKASDVIQSKVLAAKTIADVDKLMAEFVQ